MIQHALREIVEFAKFVTAPAIAMAVIVGCGVGVAFAVPPIVWAIEMWVRYWLPTWF